MKVISITEVREDTAKVFRQAQESDEPVLVVSRSKPTAYILGAARYEALLDEIKELRRAELLRDIAEAKAEVRRGGLPVFEDVDALIASLDADDPGSP
jgi:prevent-host-death family protein